MIFHSCFPYLSLRTYRGDTGLAFEKAVELYQEQACKSSPPTSGPSTSRLFVLDWLWMDRAGAIGRWRGGGREWWGWFVLWCLRQFWRLWRWRYYTPNTTFGRHTDNICFSSNSCLICYILHFLTPKIHSTTWYLNVLIGICMDLSLIQTFHHTQCICRWASRDCHTRCCSWIAQPFRARKPEIGDSTAQSTDCACTVTYSRWPASFLVSPYTICICI